MPDPISGLAGLASPISAVSEGLGVLEGGFQLFESLRNLKRDKQELSKLKRPFMPIPGEYYENRNLAASEAMTGLSQASKDYFTQTAGEGLSSSLRAIKEAGGGANDIARLLSAHHRSISSIAVEDSLQHVKNIDYFIGRNKELAGEKTTQFAVNELQPYEQKLKELTQRRAADTQSAYGGASTAIGSLQSLGTGLSNQSMIDKFFQKQDPFATPSGDVNSMLQQGEYTI